MPALLLLVQWDCGCWLQELLKANSVLVPGPLVAQLAKVRHIPAGLPACLLACLPACMYIGLQ